MFASARFYHVTVPGYKNCILSEMVRRLALTGPSASCSGNTFYSSGTFFEGSEELTAGYSSPPCILLLENSSYWLLFARHAPSLLADQSHIDLIFRKSCLKSANLSHQKAIEMYQLSESGNKSWFLRGILLCPEMVSTFNNQVLKKNSTFPLLLYIMSLSLSLTKAWIWKYFCWPMVSAMEQTIT